jgi:hypothetical protein
MVRKFRVLLSAATLASLLSVVSVVSALAGDGQGPMPR